jgi:hypothetical protein
MKDILPFVHSSEELWSECFRLVQASNRAVQREFTHQGKTDLVVLLPCRGDGTDEENHIGILTIDITERSVPQGNLSARGRTPVFTS